MLQRFLLFITLAFAAIGAVKADAIDSLQTLLRDKPQVQEKIYVHTDNSMYFVGDTLWYKAYVVRADNLQPTDMSKLLYVELLTPDGYLVERQHVVVSGNGHTCGQFILEDSLYSGYYEIRAYTRWQLNFNVEHKKYSRDDRLKFYGKNSAADFFRDFQGLYSRVLPVYEKPKEAGNYIDRYMAKRPKQRVLKEHVSMNVSFYPEGGHLILGVPCNIAFEVKDNNGQNLDIEGTLSDGTKIKTHRQGRGEFLFTPTEHKTTATFHWNDKDYVYHLPAPKENGLAMKYDAHKKEVEIRSKGVAPAAYAILCRGKMAEFKRIDGKQKTISLAHTQMPTGINELIIYDQEAQPLASRLFFINNHDYGKGLDIRLATDSAEVTKKTTLAPYEKVNLTLAYPMSDENKKMPISIAVRDAQTDEKGYNDGNIMTDMLLSSELKGFIANPAYYFEKDDDEHTANLDMLMKVQGWRRYNRVDSLRYTPEKSLTFEGQVLKVPEVATMLELEDLIEAGVGSAAKSLADQMMEEMEKLTGVTEGQTFMETFGADTDSEEEESATTGIADDGPSIEQEMNDVFAGTRDNSNYGSGKVRKEILVEAEIAKEGKSGGVITRTDKKGRFVINLPAFYDKAILFVKAYSVKDSINKCMASMKDTKEWMDEREYPDYFVKRDMIYPIFSQPYSWYQVNSPDLNFVEEDEEGGVPENSSLAGNHTLQTVVVKAKRRGKRAIDMTKPAIVRDAYAVYNDLTDYGLSLGVLNFKSLPLSVATYYFGNMGRRTQFKIRAMVDGTSFYRNYVPSAAEYDKPATPAAVYQKLKLSRMRDIRLFTDYELRTDSGDVVETHSADVTIDFVPLENDAKRYTYRDRRYVLDGVTYPEAFYSPDYSNAIPEEPKDYRRTLYWNPNAKVAEDGTFHATFYNNARETRVIVSAEGIDSQGQMYSSHLTRKENAAK